MKVRDMMRREVVTLDATDHLDLADGIMRLGRIRHLPVVSSPRPSASGSRAFRCGP